MPTSNWNSISPILELIMDIEPRPRRVLDVGLGYGKYGMLCREYLTYWDDHLAVASSKRQLLIDGIEAFPEYIGELQRAIYDHIYIGEANQVLRDIADNSYDLLLAIDILEHMDEVVGAGFIQQCQRISSVCIISTPVLFAPQEGKWGNPYEEHQAAWNESALKRSGAQLVLKTSNYIAVFARNGYREQFRRLYRRARSLYRCLPIQIQEHLGVDSPIVKPFYRWLKHGTSE